MFLKKKITFVCGQNNPMKKQRIGIACGGYTSEAEISLGLYFYQGGKNLWF